MGVHGSDDLARLLVYPVLDSTVSYTFQVFATQTTISNLLIRKARAGSKVRVLCTGRGCRFKTKSRSVKRDQRTVSLTKLVRGSRLRKDARIEVRITKPRFVGVVSRRTMRAGKRPVRRDLCVAPGAKAATRCPD